MILFNADLDNTMIYSYKHDIGEKKIGVEEYQGRTISFMTVEAHRLLQKVRKKVIFVPTTTRTEEQYGRIDFGFPPPEMALVCNGGVLLRNGQEDTDWYEDSLKLVSDCRFELKAAEKYLLSDANVDFEVRNIRNLFVFTKSQNPEMTISSLEKHIDCKKMDLYSNGHKVYAVPKAMNKGQAVKRFRKCLNPDMLIAAGDSIFDLSMIEAADMGFAPENLSAGLQNPFKRNIITCSSDENLSEFVLNSILNLVQKEFLCT